MKHNNLQTLCKFLQCDSETLTVAGMNAVVSGPPVCCSPSNVDIHCLGKEKLKVVTVKSSDVLQTKHFFVFVFFFLYYREIL